MGKTNFDELRANQSLNKLLMNARLSAALVECNKEWPFKVSCCYHHQACVIIIVGLRFLVSTFFSPFLFLPLSFFADVVFPGGFLKQKLDVWERHDYIITRCKEKGLPDMYAGQEGK